MKIAPAPFDPHFFCHGNLNMNAQLTVIDVLATGFTLRRGAKFRDNLKRVKEALKESRFDKQLLNLSDDR
ncbi:hypothetical protein ACN55_16060 [Escherichia coli]|nr:hypothetical protein ACN55_16060 [Escherichia coli]